MYTIFLLKTGTPNQITGRTNGRTRALTREGANELTKKRRKKERMQIAVQRKRYNQTFLEINDYISHS